MIINVNGQLITVADRNLLVSGSVNIYGAVVNFSPEWEGFEKVIVWKRVGAAITEPIIRPIVNGIGSIPNEIVSDPGRIRVGVAGVTATKRMPTVWSEVFEVVPGAYPGAFIPEPDPDIWQQFAEVLEEIRREAAETISTAGEVMQTATSAAQASADKAAEASQSASNAAVSAQNAAESASAASASKAAASQSASDAESAKTAAESAKSAVEAAKDDAFASMREADAAATRAAQSATNAANTLASVNAQADARKAEINELASAQKTQITDLTESKKGEIQAKGDEVLASIQEDYTEVLSDIGALKQDKADKTEVEALRAELAENKRVDDYRWAMAEGTVWAEESDSTEAYSKTIPSGAKMADVQMIGGKSIVWNQLAKQRRDGITENGVTFDVTKYGEIHAYGTAIGNAIRYFNTADKIIAGHKYYVAGLSEFVSVATYRIQLNVNSNNGVTVNGKSTIWVAQTGGRMDLYFVCLNGNAVDTIIKPRLVDLTVMGMDDITSVDDPRIAMIEVYAASHPEYNAGEIIHADVDEVQVRGSNAEIQPQLIPIPEAVRQIDGYGWSADDLCNEVDLVNKQFIKRVTKFVVTDEAFNAYGIASTGMPVISYNISVGQKVDAYNAIKAITSDGRVVSLYASDDKSVRFLNSQRVVFYDTSFTDEVQAKEKMRGVEVVVERSNPVITDISDLLDSRFEDLDVEAGGSITYHQSDDSKHLPVPNTVDYTVKLSEVV